MLNTSYNPGNPRGCTRYEYRKVGSEAWEGLLDSKSRLELSGLDMLQQYEFRVFYIGRDAIPNFSDITTAIVV